MPIPYNAVNGAALAKVLINYLLPHEREDMLFSLLTDNYLDNHESFYADMESLRNAGVDVDFDGTVNVPKEHKVDPRYPPGVLAVWDSGSRVIDRYTVVYTPYVMIDGQDVFLYVCMSEHPTWPTGICSHGESVGKMPMFEPGKRLIPFARLPLECQQFVRNELAEQEGIGDTK